MKWRTIDSAPKDGTGILGWAPGFEEPERLAWDVEHGRWLDAYGEREDPMTYPEWKPTHWMPLPEPPAAP